jgi:photosystem II stability/assembly factor-like uncharacterized protein
VALLLALAAGSARHPGRSAPPSHGFLVHGRRLAFGLPPTRGAEDDETGGSRRERLVRWIESRHRAAPGFDWAAIEAANLQANLRLVAARAAEKARGGQGVWHERGPVNQTGATALAAVRPDGKTLLVATSQGGVFSGAPGAPSWKRLTDSLGGYVHGFLVSDRPETWAAAVFTLTDSRVYASRNRGAAWTAARGLPPLDTVDEMIQDGGDHRTIYLLAQTGGGIPLLARSRDGGLSYSVVWTGSGPERPGIWTSRVAAGPLYLMSRGQLLLSTDRGSSFSPLGQAGDSVGYAVLRGSEAGAPTLYAALGKGSPESLYVSEDGGRTWESRFKFAGTSYYAFDALYTGALAASIRDPNLVLFGNADGFRSTDGGRTFQMINDWSDYYDSPGDRLHADINGIQFVLYHGQETLFLSTDGGTYLSTDGGLDVQNITEIGLPSGQFYSTWSSLSNPDLFLVGSQDQGLQLSLAGSGRTGAPLSNAQLISGDYSGLTSASHDFTNIFAVYPTGSAAKGLIVLFNPAGDPDALITADLPSIPQSGFFVTTAADPDDPATVYVAGDHIWRMRYMGGENFAPTQLPQNFSPDNHDYVSALAIAPSNHDVWYVTTDQGHLWYSRDRGATWTESDTTRAKALHRANSTLLVSTTDPLTCFVGGSGYGNPPVLVTRDGGVTWSALANGLPGTTVWALAFDDPAAQTLYAATEAGPYRFDKASSTWRTLLGGGAPVGRYFSVEGVPSAHLVRFGTFSRGVFDYVLPPRR